jgi:SRSO17 transposase
MERRDLMALEKGLGDFAYELFRELGRVERRVSLAWYIAGLLLNGERKSIQPMAARLVDKTEDAEAMRQRLQEAVVSADWNDEVVRARLAALVGRRLKGLEALVVDDTGFPKKGTKSPGVSRQYSGTLGRVDNCQIAVSVHVAGPAGGVGLAMRLYLPPAWADDEVRRATAHIPPDVTFRKKWEIAHDLIDAVRSWGVPQKTVCADAGYGEVHAFREGLIARELSYVVGIPSNIAVWRPGEGPTAPTVVPYSGSGRPPKPKYQDGPHSPVEAGDLAVALGKGKAQAVTWNGGPGGEKTGMFGVARVRTAHHHGEGAAPGPEQWLLYEYMGGEEKPRLWLSNLPPNTPIEDLVRLAKLRWRIERDYQELKEEIGLDHYEGRTWRGFHHHATLAMAAHAFLVLQRTLSPPEPQRQRLTRTGRPPGGADAHAGHLPQLPQTSS